MDKTVKKSAPAKKKTEKPVIVQAVIANIEKPAEKALTQDGVVKWAEAVNTLPYYLL